MKLKWQLGLIAITSLAFPMVIWLAFNSLNQTFQSNMLIAANKQAQVIVNSVQQYHQDRTDKLTGLISSSLDQDVAIDGNTAEWANVPWYTISHRMRFKLGRHLDQLMLLVQVKDQSRFIHATEPSDRLILAIADERGINRHQIRRQAEGAVFSDWESPDWKAYWHETAQGYEVEISLPARSVKRLGLAAINHATADSAVRFGHLSGNQIQLQGLFEPNPKWVAFLDQITPADGQIRLIDPAGRLFYHSSKTLSEPAETDWLTELIYEFAFDQNQQDGSHFRGQRVYQPFAAGRIELLVQHTDAQTALIQTFIRALSWIFGISLLLLLVYFAYASFLAWRIRRLNRHLQHVLDERGQIHSDLPARHASDEIGDLSRGMSKLLHQINDYTEYLKQLGSRLSHEMKTPISIVHTSLENLSMDHPHDPFIDRALTANNRLKFILNQLSALSMLKQSINQASKQPFDLNAFTENLVAGYQMTAHHIAYQGPNAPVQINGSEELMAQMLDKLVQNAMDFTSNDDQIKITLSQSNGSYELQVLNSGSQIPEDKVHQLFDSLTSFRDAKSDQPHLGLGLYIARLICDYHQAEIKAKNLKSANSVAFTITGPLA